MANFSVKNPVSLIEWKLLVFLILFMDVKLVVKFSAVLFIYFTQPDFRFGFRTKDSRLPLFYLVLIIISALNYIMHPQFPGNYIWIVLTGIMMWMACILAVHQVKLFAEKTERSVLDRTIRIFFLVNILISLINLTAICMEIGFRNPFLYQGQYQRYFINTGDFIRGISFDSSTTNAVINCFGVIYFLYTKKYWLVLVSMVTLLLCGSNFSNIVLMVVLAGLFVFRSDRDQKSVIAVCCMLLVCFLSVISPQNDNYLVASINKYLLQKKEDTTIHKKEIAIRERPDSLLTPETSKQKTAILYLDSLERIHQKQIGILGNSALWVPARKSEIPSDSIRTAKFQWRTDTSVFQRMLQQYISAKNIKSNLPVTTGTVGKLQALKQSLRYLNVNRQDILTGAGTGNFSSKLAYRATGLKIAGGFPSGLLYSNADFLENHFFLYAYFFSRRVESHSIIHNPASVYDQLVTEYGVLGLAAFYFYYIGYFLKNRKQLTYALPMLILLLSFFLIDYWFEQLSVVVLFELLFFSDIKEHLKTAEIV